MPGKTQDIGTTRARVKRPRHVQDLDFSKEFPGLKIVLLSKTEKVSPSMLQTESYEQDGYKWLMDTDHKDIAVYGMPIEDYEDMKADERELGDMSGVTRKYVQPVSRQELHSYGVPGSEE